MEREKLRREAEEARRTQNVTTVETNTKSFLPPPRKVGKSSPTDSSLHTKLSRFFGDFDTILPYVAKDENHVRIVGVTGYPPTPNVSDNHNLSAISDVTTGSSVVAAPSVSNLPITTDIIKSKSSKNQNTLLDNQSATSSKTTPTERSKNIVNGVKLTKPGAPSSVDGRNGDAHSSENGNKPVKDKNKDKRVVDGGYSGVASGSSTSVNITNKVNSLIESSTSKNRDQEKSSRTSSGGSVNGNSNEINNRPPNASAGRIDKYRDKHKDADDYKKRDSNRHNNDHVNHNHRHRYSSDDDVSKSRRSPSSSRTNSAHNGSDSKRDNKEHSDDDKKSKDVTRRENSSDDSKKKISSSLPKDQQHKGKTDNKNRPSLKLPAKIENDEILDDEDFASETNNQSHMFASISSSPHGPNSLIKKVKDILVTPLSGIDVTPSERKVFSFSDKKKNRVKTDQNIVESESPTTLTNENSKNCGDNERFAAVATTPTKEKNILNKEIDKQKNNIDIKRSLLGEDLELSEDDDDFQDNRGELNNSDDDDDDDDDKEAGFVRDTDNIYIEEEPPLGSNNKTASTIKPTSNSSSQPSNNNVVEQEISSSKLVQSSKSPVASTVDNKSDVASNKFSMPTNQSTNCDSKKWTLESFLFLTSNSSDGGTNESTASSSSSPRNTDEQPSTSKYSKVSTTTTEKSSSNNNVGGNSKNVQIKSQENVSSVSNQRKHVATEDKDKNLKLKISKKNGVKIVTDQQKIKDDKLCEPSSSKSMSNDDSVKKRKKPKLDKSNHRAIHDSTSNVASTSSSSVVEQVSTTTTTSATNGFVDTGSPGKENYSNINAPPSNGDDGGGPGGDGVEVGAVRKKYSNSKNAETILQESRLSPLLSPIHDFPPFEYRNGLPSLMCRLPLTLLSRIPPDPQLKVTNNVQRNKVKINSSALSESMDFKSIDDVDDVDIPPPSLSPSPNLFLNGDDLTINLTPSHSSKNRKRPSSNIKNVNTKKKAETSNKDLDDVPISERIPKKISAADKKITEKVNSATTESTSSRFDGKRDAASLLTGTGLTLTNSVTATSSSSVEKTINDVASSLLLSTNDDREKSDRKKNVSGSKRKISTVDDTIKTEESTPSKKQKLDSNLMACAPEKHLIVDSTVKDPKFYMDKAKEIKHRADGQGVDRSMRLVFYLESIIYFFLTGYSMEKTLKKESQRPFAMVKDTQDLLKNVTQKYMSQLNELNETTQTLFAHKIEVLSLRIQALLFCQMFSLKQSSILTNFRHISDYQKNVKDRPSSVHGGLSTTTTLMNENLTPSRTIDDKPPSSSLTTFSNGINSTSSSRPNTSSTPSPTPSPASSTGSSSHSLPPGLVAIPQQVELMYKQQLSYLHNLLMAHHHWQLADSKLKQHDYSFFNHLDSICRPLTLTSTVPSICVYVLTATHWLRQLYNQL